MENRLDTNESIQCFSNMFKKLMFIVLIKMEKMQQTMKFYSKNEKLKKIYI
jgi:hypothetical protein